MNEDRQGLVVIGAGQMRTGTLSLKTALELLYGGDCYHMEKFFFKHRNHMNLWMKAFDQGFLDEDLSKQLFQGYVCAVDNPVAPFYKDLMKIYPNAQVILSTRDSTQWVKSVRSTTMKRRSTLRRLLENLVFYSLGLPRFEELIAKMFYKAFNHPMKVLQCDDELLKKCFEEYNDEVRRTVPKDRLLEFHAKDGWEPLCKFLNLPIPNEPYPRVNSSSDFNAVRRKLFFEFLLKYGSIIAVTVACSIFIYRRWK